MSVDTNDSVQHRPEDNVGTEKAGQTKERSLEAQFVKKKVLVTEYTTTLRPWVELYRAKQKKPANKVKNNAYQSFQEVFEELESKLGDTLQNNEDRVKQVMKYLRKGFAVAVNSDDVLLYKPKADWGTEEAIQIEERLWNKREKSVDFCCCN